MPNNKTYFYKLFFTLILTWTAIGQCRHESAFARTAKIITFINNIDIMVWTPQDWTLLHTWVPWGLLDFQLWLHPLRCLWSAYRYAFSSRRISAAVCWRTRIGSSMSTWFLRRCLRLPTSFLISIQCLASKLSNKLPCSSSKNGYVRTGNNALLRFFCLVWLRNTFKSIYLQGV